MSRIPTNIVAVVQMCSTGDKAKNLKTIKHYVNLAKRHRADAVFFPECSDFIADSKSETIQKSESLNGGFMSEILNLSRASEMHISVCMHLLAGTNDTQQLYNANVITDRDGQVASVYKKVHLFDCPDIDGTIYKESDAFAAGDKLSLCPTDFGKIGQCICYDLRFPEFSCKLREKGADILAYPAAFTTVTGKAHWEVLLRARAIENQCYVLAPAQCGRNSKKRHSYGHSMIVNPWGDVVSQLKNEESGIIYAELDNCLMASIRANMPVFMHRKNYY